MYWWLGSWHTNTQQGPILKHQPFHWLYSQMPRQGPACLTLSIHSTVLTELRGSDWPHEGHLGELLRTRSDFCTAVCLVQGVTCCWGHRKACCFPAFCRHSSSVTSHLSTRWQSHHPCRVTCIFRAMELPQCGPPRPFPSHDSVTDKFLLPDLLPIFPLPSKPNFPPALKELQKVFFLLPKWNSLSFTIPFLTPSCASCFPPFKTRLSMQ